MAPTPTHESPQVQLGRLMLAARRRGLDFDTWWDEAVREGQALVMTNYEVTYGKPPPAGCIRWPTDRNDRVAWQFGIRESKEAWRRVYERAEPTPGDRAIAVIAESIGALDRVADERGDTELDSAMKPQAALRSAA